MRGVADGALAGARAEIPSSQVSLENIQQAKKQDVRILYGKLRCLHVILSQTLPVDRSDRPAAGQHTWLWWSSSHRPAMLVTHVARRLRLLPGSASRTC